MFSQARKYILYTHKPELTTGEKGPIQHIGCWGQWLEESRSTAISVVEGVSGVHAHITFGTEEGAWTAITATDNSGIARTLLAHVGFHIFSCNCSVNQLWSCCPPAF